MVLFSADQSTLKCSFRTGTNWFSRHFSLPQHCHGILRNLGIGREQRESFDDCLTHQHAVEWILVQIGQPPNRKAGVFTEGKGRDFVADSFRRHERSGRLWQG